ncbi:MAG: hypothetical protein RSC26_16230 [Terrisporobacter sp.]
MICNNCNYKLKLSSVINSIKTSGDIKCPKCNFIYPKFKNILLLISLIFSMIVTFIINITFLNKVDIWFLSPVLELILLLIFYYLLKIWISKKKKVNIN